MLRSPAWIVRACFLIAVLITLATQSVRAAPPANFTAEPVITDLIQPIALRFLPDGRMLLVHKKGEVRIVDVTELPADSEIYMDLNFAFDGLESDQERGVLDIAIDPDFSPSQPYIYLLYTPLERVGGGPGRLRVSRFTHVENTGGLSSRGNLDTELVIWEDTNGYDSCCHYGGGLDFGPDGNLWLTTGDHFEGFYASSLTKAGGGVHRFGKDGSIPPGNPYVDGPGGNVDSLFAYGLRNPFRARWDLPSGRFFIAEVGGNTQSIAWEDLHIIQYDPMVGFLDSDGGTYDGINFGWPTVEGPPPHTDFPGATVDPAGEPIFSYPHAGNTAAINGGIVYRGSQFPVEYYGAYFYADSTRDFVRYIKFNPDGTVAPNPNPDPISLTNPEAISYSFDSQPVGRIVSLDVGPDGALYYVSFTDSGGAYGEPNPSVLGSVRRYVYSSGNARPEIVEYLAEPLVPNGLEVEFVIHATDPELDPMTYVVDFGDGTTSTPPANLPGNEPVTISHTYAIDGVYDAELSVSDGILEAREVLPVAIGTPPTVAPISAFNSRPNPPDAPIAGPVDTFRFGDTFTFTGSATDKHGTPISGDHFTWVISFVRPGNTHPAFGPASGTAIDFPIPNQGQGFSGPVFYRVFLTVTDPVSQLTTTVEYDIHPEKSNIYFDSVPSGMVVQVDGNTEVQTPFVLDTLINFDHTIAVPALVCFGDSEYEFVDWSNGETTNRFVFNVPETDSALTASYNLTGPCSAVTPATVVPIFDGQTLNGLYPWFSESGASDPEGVFTVQNGQLHVTGESWGALGTAETYRDYIMVLEFKWGDRTWPPREGKAKDAGLIVHSRGAADGWNNLLMPGIQAQMAEGSMGDIILLKGFDAEGGTLPMSMTSLVEQVACTFDTWNCRDGYRWTGGGVPQLFDQAGDAVHWYGWDPDWVDEVGFRGDIDLESPDGDWNQLVVIAEGDTLQVYFNGVLVNEASGVVPSQGRIQLESEFAEFFVRRWELLPLGQPIGAVITTDRVPNGTVGVPYSEFIDATGGVPPLNWSVASGLPEGMSLDPATGELSGTPTTPGEYDLVVDVTDNTGTAVSGLFPLVVTEIGPKLITNGLVLQLEADLNVSIQTGTTVEGWLDQSGFGNDLIASGNPQLLADAAPAGLPAIHLDGNDKLERIHAGNPLGGLPTGNADRTIFMVANYLDSSAWGGLSYGNAAQNQAFGLIVKHPSGELVLQGWGGANDLVSSEPGIGAGWLVQSAVVADGMATLYRDGTGPVAQFNHNYATVLNKLVLGEEITGKGFVSMDVGAVLIYDRALTQAEHQSVEMYLRNKYIGPAANGVPVVTINQPPDGTVFAEGEPIHLAAVATDAEDGDLSSAIVWISDLDGVLGNGASLTVPSLSAGERLITAQVTDSGSPAHIGDDSITLFIIEHDTNTAPEVVISAPSDGATFEAGEPINLIATATDSEDGDLGAGIVWSSNLDGALGSGTALSVSSLSAGNHVITAQVTDNGSPAKSGEDSVTVAVNSPAGMLPVTGGLVVRLESDQEVFFATETTVSEWHDLSGQGNHLFSQGDTRLVPGSTPSGLPALFLDGAGDKLERTATLTGLPAGNTDRTMFFVANYLDSTSWAGVSYGNAASNQTFGLIVKHPSGELVLQGWGGANDLVSAQPGIGAGWLIQSAIVANGTATLYRDGAGPIAQFGHNYDTALNELVVGEEITGKGFATMEVGALLIYNRALTAAEHASVEAYLLDKYIEPATHPDPANTAPTLNIVQPADGAVFDVGESIDLSATATDSEDGDLGAAITWSSDLDGALGTGASLSVSTLSPGSHLITAQVSDNGSPPLSTKDTASILVSTSNIPFQADLVLHLEADNGVGLSGTTVTGWSDLSGLQNDLIASGGVLFNSAATPSGQPAISLDGTSGKLQRVHGTHPLTGLPTGNADRTMLLVVRYHGTTWWAGTAYGSGNKNQTFGLGVKHPTGELFLQGWGGGNDLVSTIPGLGAGWMTHSAVLGGGIAEMFRDGSSVAQFTHNYNTVLEKLIIGQEIAGLGYVGMDIAAVLIYNRALSPTERANVETYLRDKYLAPEAGF